MVSLLLLSILQLYFHFQQLHAFTKQEYYECADFKGDHAESKKSQIMKMDALDQNALGFLFVWCDEPASSDLSGSSDEHILERSYSVDAAREMPQFGIGYFKKTKSLVIYIEGTDFENAYDTTNLMNAKLDIITISNANQVTDHFDIQVHQGFNTALNTEVFTTAFVKTLASVLQQIYASDTALVGFSGDLLIQHVYITGHSQGGAIAEMIYAQFYGKVPGAFVQGLMLELTKWFGGPNQLKFTALINDAKVITFGAPAWLYHEDEMLLSEHKATAQLLFYYTMSTRIWNYFVPKEPGALLLSGTVKSTTADKWFKTYPFKYTGTMASVYYMYSSFNHFASFAPIGLYVLISNNKFYKLTKEDMVNHINDGAQMCEMKSTEASLTLAEKITNAKATLLLDINTNHRMSNYMFKTKAAIDAQHSGFIINLMYATIGLFIMVIVVFVCIIMFVCGLYTGSFVAILNKNKKTSCRNHIEMLSNIK